MLISAAANDSFDGVRSAAHETLEKMPLDAEMLLPFLDITGSSKPRAKSTKRSKKNPTEGENETTTPEDNTKTTLAVCLNTLNLLQWKHDIQSLEVLVTPLLDLVKELQVMAEIQDYEEDKEGKRGPALCYYGIQLALFTLLYISESALSSAKEQSFDIPAIVSCASMIPDPGVRASALDLLRSRIVRNPAKSVSYVMKTVEIIGGIAASSLDKYSTALAAQTMSAAAAAWLNAGNSITQLVPKVIESIEPCQVSRRYIILGSLVDAMASGASEAMACIAYNLIASGVREEENEWKIDAAASILSKVCVLGACNVLKQKFQRSMMKHCILHVSLTIDDTLHTTHTHGGRSCICSVKFLFESYMKGTKARQIDKNLMFDLQRSPKLCISALGGMLMLALKSEDVDLEVLSMSNKLAASTLKRYSESLKDTDDVIENLLESYDLLIHCVLQELRLIGQTRAKSSDPELKEIEDGAYGLLEGLKDIMDAGNFIAALVRVISHPDAYDQIRRKAFSLFTSVVSKFSDLDIEDPALQQPVYDCVGTIVSMVQENKRWTDLTRQACLGCMSTLTQRLGAKYSDTFMQSVPTIVELVTEESTPAIRGMSLVCIASYISSMKNRVVPVIPKIIAAVLTGSKSALDSVQDRKDSSAAHVELRAALGALQSLTVHLAPFLAPNLRDILSLLLHPRIVRNEDEDCLLLGDSCRSEISSEVPARLLLGPLSDAFDSDNMVDTHSLRALLSMLSNCIRVMEASQIISYHASVFAMILKGLDIRRQRGSSATAPSEIQMAEDAAIECMVQLTLKLNESRFKPIFYRLLEWANTNPDGETDEDNISVERRITLFSAANALTENLRSIFTPYYRALLDPIIKSIQTPCPAANKGRTKKSKVEYDRKLNTMLKITAMRALTRCFMYDTTSFLDEARFEMVLGPIVDEFGSLDDHPTSLTQGFVPEDGVIQRTLSDNVTSELGLYPQTIIACLTQMASASGSSDARWRPLHHSVLMVTRSQNPTSRLAALETTLGIYEVIQEEYLPLLPEALPFLSELLEDEDGTVEGRTVEVLRKMEELSGEDLKQYLRGA